MDESGELTAQVGEAEKIRKWPQCMGSFVRYHPVTVTSICLGNIFFVRFQALTAASMKLRIVFWDVLPCKIIVDRRFRGTCCLHHQGWHPWSLMMEVASTYETSVDNYFTRQYIPEDNSELFFSFSTPMWIGGVCTWLSRLLWLSGLNGPEYFDVHIASAYTYTVETRRKIDNNFPPFRSWIGRLVVPLKHCLYLPR
jgi:hypothetical protein